MTPYVRHRLDLLLLAREPTRQRVCAALEVDVRRVTAVADRQALMLRLWEHPPDVIIVEGPPQQSEVPAVCRQLRQFFQTPIMVVEEGASEGERICWLDSGADDVLALGVSAPAELAARCQALLRRTLRQQRRDPAALRLQADGVELDVAGRRLYPAVGSPADLSARHTRLLALLCASDGGVVPASALAQHMAVGDVALSDRRIASLVLGLNRRLASLDAQLPRIERVRGRGYRLALRGADNERGGA